MIDTNREVQSIARTLSSMDIKDTMQLLVSDITHISSEIYCEGIIGLSTELRSTRNLLKNAKENTDTIRKQMEHANSELAIAKSMLEESQVKSNEMDIKLRKTLAELEELKGKALGKLTFISQVPVPSVNNIELTHTMISRR